MATTLKLLLTDPTTYQTLFTAVATAAYASYRANEPLYKSLTSSSSGRIQSLPSSLIDENSRILEGPLALAFPFIATFSIVLLFFFLTSVGVILTSLSAVSGFISLLFLIWPLAEFLGRRLRAIPGVRNAPETLIESIIAVPFATAVVLIWLFSGNWFANNLMGIALCLLFASLCKVPSLKVTVMLFTGLFVYDIFFVFFSERVFGKNVMVEVATSTPTNPVFAIAEFFHLPFTPVKNLALPAKLIFPSGDGQYTILGLGDIILPEILLVYLLEFDLRSRSPAHAWRGYFARAVLTYAVGLFASFYFSFAFQAAQPALLYIVPMVILPTVFVAKKRRELGRMWKGSWRSESEEDDRRREIQSEKEGEQEALLT